MFELLFGSYSIDATVPGTPSLSLLKSITRYFLFSPPPWCLTVILPWLLRPPFFFNVKVENVNTINVKSKKKRVGRYVGKTNKVKKAIVKLKEGSSIELN